MQATFHGLRIAVIALVGYWIMLFTATHIPTGDLLSQLQASDKLMHCCAFTGLSFLMAWAMPTNRTRPAQNILIAAALCVVYAAIDELLQIPVGRHADWRDFIADCVGVAIGLTLYTMIRTCLHRAGIEVLQDDRTIAR